jgi:hypothetical protein
MSWGYSTLIGLTGLGVGAYVSETAKRAAGSVFDRIGGRGRAAHAMNQVVLEVPARWEGYSYEFEELDVVGMRLALTLTNHSDQLIKNVHVRMRRPPSEVDVARMVPAIAPGARSSFTISRDLGLVEDAPFEEEAPGWQINYSFEADFDDADGRRWRLRLDPSTWTQGVSPLRRSDAGRPG